jgi:hypothetical protein
MRLARPMPACGTSPSPPISLLVSTMTTRLSRSSASSLDSSRMAVVFPTPGRPINNTLAPPDTRSATRPALQPQITQHERGGTVRGQAERQTRHVSPPCSHAVKATDNPLAPGETCLPFLSCLAWTARPTCLVRPTIPLTLLHRQLTLPDYTPPPLPSSPAVNRAAHPTCQAHDASSPVA